MAQLNNFHFIYIFFLIVLVFCLLFKESKTKAIFITLLYILIFVFAETGADYGGYKYIYENCNLPTVHGEPLFLLICKLMNMLGVSYEMFRVLFLTIFTIILNYSIYKLSVNFTLSFTIMYMVYTIYLVSAYRQFATMAIFLLSIYLFFFRNKKLSVILLNLIFVFIHKVAIVQLVLFIILWIYKFFVKSDKSVERVVVRKFFFLIMFFVLMFRVGLYFVLSNQFIYNVISDITNYPQTSLINFGMISRLALLIIITDLFLQSSKNIKWDIIYSIYFISIIFYLIMPYELLMGRLVNNIRILEIVLIPNLLNSHVLGKRIDEYKHYNVFSIRKKNIIHICLFVLVTGFIFSSQMLNQGGYDIFNHMVWRII